MLVENGWAKYITEEAAAEKVLIKKVFFSNIKKIDGSEEKTFAVETRLLGIGHNRTKRSGH